MDPATPVPGGLTPGVRFRRLESRPDDRGLSFALGDALAAYLGRPEDLHVMTLDPGHLRGNHSHPRRREVLIVLHEGRWRLHYEVQPGEEAHSREFSGRGCVWVEVDPGCAHTVVNDGAATLHLFACADGRFDPEEPDQVRRILVDPASLRSATGATPR